MESKIINNIKETKYDSYEGKIIFPLFNKEIGISFDKDVDLEYAEKCAEYLMHLSDKVIDDLCESAISYYEDYVREDCRFEENMPLHITGREILDYMDPVVVIISKPPTNNNIGFNMELNCVWEEEHGMSWIVRDDKTIYMSWFDTISPWKEKGFYKEANYNFANTYYKRPELVIPEELQDRMANKTEEELNKTKKKFQKMSNEDKVNFVDSNETTKYFFIILLVMVVSYILLSFLLGI